MKSLPIVTLFVLIIAPLVLGACAPAATGLRSGMLNPAQTELVWALRDGLSQMAEKEALKLEINMPVG
jgi:hypothetical protein